MGDLIVITDVPSPLPIVTFPPSSARFTDAPFRRGVQVKLCDQGSGTVSIGSPGRLLDYILL